MMRLLARPGVSEAIASLACLTVLLVALVAIDSRVRERATGLFTQVSVQSAEGWSQRLGSFASAVFEAARDRTLDQAPLFVFVAVGAVLLVLMLRT